MAKAIEQILNSGGKTLTIGHFGLGMHGQDVGSAKQQVHDGDTITVRALGNFGVRFLGVDAPEISFRLPGIGQQQFIPVSDPRWEAFLRDPFAGSEGAAFRQSLRPALVSHLEAHLGPGVATSHHRHAVAAQRALEHQVEADMSELGETKETFEFFLVFAAEVSDRYGRVLAYINRRQDSGSRPLDYNRRLLKAGLIDPYFIWPNINPFRKQKSAQDAVPLPGTANTLAQKDGTLQSARQWVMAARQSHLGLHDAQNPLRLRPFELRFLAQRIPPSRWVIDLSKNDDQLLHPENYHTIPQAEDRLFVPAEYVPLFLEKGWQLAL